jgi:hypothetical protein
MARGQVGTWSKPRARAIPENAHRRLFMRRSLAIVLMLCVSGLALSAQTKQEKTAPASAEEALKALRAETQAQKAAILGKNMSLSAEQAAKFWPLFEAYQKEQNAIVDQQLEGIQQYVNNYKTLDDASSLTLITSHFERDEKMSALRRKWLGEFQKVLPTKLAVRAMQIDRRLSLALQSEIASYIPLSTE